MKARAHRFHLFSFLPLCMHLNKHHAPVPAFLTCYKKHKY